LIPTIPVRAKLFIYLAVYFHYPYEVLSYAAAEADMRHLISKFSSLGGITHFPEYIS